MELRPWSSSATRKFHRWCSLLLDQFESLFAAMSSTLFGPRNELFRTVGQIMETTHMRDGYHSWEKESADIIHHPIRYSLISRVPKQIKNLHNVVGISDVECLNQLRMTRDVFSRLCFVLQNSGGLKASRNTSVGEQVAMIVKSKYMRSGRTVSKYFHRVLNAIIKLHKILFARPNPIDDECNDNR
ncbi:hypothetical protein ACS0TY_034648 [Phlomoides rotata]